MTRTELAGLGRAFARKSFGYANVIVGPIVFGYGSRKQFGQDSIVALLGYTCPGGATILGAGKPLKSPNNTWFPFQDVDTFTFSYIGREIDLCSLTSAATSFTALESAEFIRPDTEEFFEWLGFLLSVKDHPEGVEIDW